MSEHPDTDPGAGRDTGPAAVARRFVALLEARDWAAWQELLDPDVVYEIPQSRERIRGREAYLHFNRTFPGDWHLQPKVVIGDQERAVVWFTWQVGEERADGQVFLELGGEGRVTRVTDFWPEPYEPPERLVEVERY